MPPRRSSFTHHRPRAARLSRRRGCLAGFLFPLLAVSGFSILLLAALIRLVQPGAPAPRAEAGGQVEGPFTPEVRYWQAEIEAWAADYALEPEWVATLMQIESCGNPRARSQAGAMGLFQVMPFHFDEDEDALDPATNARRGLSYFASALEASGGDFAMALAGYNGGIGLLSQPEDRWPEETHQYVYWGSGISQEARQGAGSSAVLNQWLAAGGSRLCDQARQVLGLHP